MLPSIASAIASVGQCSLSKFRFTALPVSFIGAPVRFLPLLSILVLLFLSLPAHAQYRLDLWTADDGLPQNNITGLCQTKDGFLWIATFDGLVQFDGVRFIVFNKRNSAGIQSNRFTSLYQDGKGDLWLPTEGSGVTRLHHGRFTTYTTQQGVPENTVRSITGDDAGQVWIISADTIAQWNEAAGRFINVTPKDLQLRYDSLLWEGGGFWGVDERGLHCFLRGRFVNYRLPRGFLPKSIWGVARDQSGKLWLETSDGKYAHANNVTPGVVNVSSGAPVLSYRDRRGHDWTMHVGRRLIRSLEYVFSGQSTQISFASLFEDRELNLWLGTSEGLSRLQKQYVTVYSKAQGLIEQNVYPIYRDHTEAMWVGTWPGGVSRFKDGTFTSYLPKPRLYGQPTTAIGEDREHRLWVATHGGLSLFQDGRFREPTGPVLPERAVVQAIHQDSGGALWFGTTRGLVRYQDGLSKLFTPADGLAANDVRVLVEGSSGELWIGGYGGLTRLQNQQFTHWTERDGLSSNNVRSIYQDSDGVLWIGTYDGGLIRFAHGKFTRYGSPQGLFNDGVFQILEDRHGRFWISCNRGIYRVDKRELNEFAAGARKTITSVSYGKSDGMLNAECNGGLWPAGAKTSDGKLWFPTQNGVAVIDPEAIVTNPQPPNVIIESVLVDHVPTAPDRALRIGPNEQNFEITYTALSFIHSKQIRFKYKMEGLDRNWIDAGPRRTAYYSHLSPGRYVFHVIAANSDGVWTSQAKSLALTVLAPFYRTWWFEALAVLGITGLVTLAWRYRVAQLEQQQASQRVFSQQLIANQENERQRIAAELHDSLGQRLIIIKNLALFSLRSRRNSAAGTTQPNSMEEISAEAASAIEETRQISYNLRPFQLDRLGLTKAVEAMVRKVSAASGIHFTSEIDTIDDVFPEELRINFYRIVQESLNNVMKHAHATGVKIRVQRSENRVILTVHDNGRGFGLEGLDAHPANTGFGLTGMAERARLLGGELKLRQEVTGGATVTVEFRLG